MKWSIFSALAAVPWVIVIKVACHPPSLSVNLFPHIGRSTSSKLLPLISWPYRKILQKFESSLLWKGQFHRGCGQIYKLRTWWGGFCLSLVGFVYKVGKLLVHPNLKDSVLVSSFQIKNSANPWEGIANPSSLMSSTTPFLMKSRVTWVDPPCITMQPFWEKLGVFAGPQSCILLHSMSKNVHVFKISDFPMDQNMQLRFFSCHLLYLTSRYVKLRKKNQWEAEDFNYQ